MRGQQQVAHDGAALHDAVFIEDGGTCLPCHLQHGSPCRLWIIGRAGIRLRQLRREVFQIRQIDVDQPFQAAERFDALIAACVVDHGDGGTAHQQRPADHRHKRRRADEIDVVRALLLKLQKQIGKLLR